MAANLQRDFPPVPQAVVFAAGKREHRRRFRAVARPSRARTRVPPVARARRLPLADQPRARLPGAPGGAGQPHGRRAGLREPAGRGHRAGGGGDVRVAGGPAQRDRDGTRRRPSGSVRATGTLEGVPGPRQTGVRMAVERGKSALRSGPEVHQLQKAAAAQNSDRRKLLRQDCRSGRSGRVRDGQPSESESRDRFVFDYECCRLLSKRFFENDVFKANVFKRKSVKCCGAGKVTRSRVPTNLYEFKYELLV